MKTGLYIIAGHFILILLWSVQAGATSLSGKFRLDNQTILISGPQKYHGHFDLRSRLPMGNEFVLSRVIVSFKFQDDREWVSKAGANSLINTGKVIRRNGLSSKKKAVAGQADHYYTAKSIIHLSNEEEVAELTIGRNKYFGTTMRRREVTRQTLGQKSLMLGTYPDEGDQGKVRQHFRITESVRELQRDGYDGLFEIRHKLLDMGAAQDLAHSGILDFELGGKGDYIFVEATVQYEGYSSGQIDPEDYGGSLFGKLTLFMLFGLLLGGTIWWKKNRTVSVKRRRIAKAVS